MSKKISKELKEEGVTMELINSINLNKSYSPVQLRKGEMPVKLLKCTTGFWIMLEDLSFLKDENNKLIVLSEKEVQIGRARYLMNYGDEEKQKQVKRLIEKWRYEIRNELDKIKQELKAHYSLLDDKSTLSILKKAISGINEEALEKERSLMSERVALLEPKYIQMENMLEENRIIELLYILNIKKFDNPMLTANFDNQDEMQILKNVFGAKALKNWDGDMLNKYAQIEIEKELLIA